ncbi:2-oxo-hept-4-ene-1,7-dioate hydratase [Undibacterium sp. TS12]|uniref:2-oxo-hept-4-ene-1,7-dioate hydratase n=1 Tax=Undibacterium sp. TS12 TaxID=2908202 RepID=UPI001F4CF9DD|nr:2-oxo-hepta-3-ene-1,7-dioic acid hydratase [Undibacterium sp. TS12]MCH8622979.1 2-oxo-hepta-3-ene-1,7-dioic acid hydratase [Undibacterium sp. TS12]
MLTADIHQVLARELHVSESTGVQVVQFSRRFPEMEISDSYAIQRAWVQIKLDEGRSIKGHKIGLTSRAMQISSQITEPDYGALLDDMFFREGADIPVSRFILPRVEVELAFVLCQSLRGPDITIFDVLSATDYVVPALEIIDARIEQVDRVSRAPRKVLDTIADNAANAGIVMGGRPVRVDTLDLRWCGALLYKNGVIEETGLAAAVLNHPANGVAWLANKLAQHGEGLKAGEVVLAGSFTRPVAGCAGDVFHADYGPLGAIAFRFV